MIMTHRRLVCNHLFDECQSVRSYDSFHHRQLHVMALYCVVSCCLIAIAVDIETIQRACKLYVNKMNQLFLVYVNHSQWCQMVWHQLWQQNSRHSAYKHFQNKYVVLLLSFGFFFHNFWTDESIWARLKPKKHTVPTKM